MDAAKPPALLDHVFQPSAYPHGLTFTSQKETAILKTASGQFLCLPLAVLLRSVRENITRGNHRFAAVV
jgi:hypothetical protein